MPLAAPKPPGESLAAILDHKARVGALSDQELKEAIGWVVFGREHDLIKGEPAEQLNYWIQYADVTNRGLAESYVIGEPIGEYVRQVQRHFYSTGLNQADAGSLEKHS